VGTTRRDRQAANVARIILLPRIGEGRVGPEPVPGRWVSPTALHDNAEIRRIVYVSHSKEVGGAELYLEGLIRFAAREALEGRPQWQPELICRRDAVVDQWAQGIAALGVMVYRIDLKRLADYVSMRRILRRAHLVHLVLAYPTGKYQLSAALLARVAGRPLVATHQLVIEIREMAMSRLRRAFWERAFRQYRRLARVNIASSRAGRQSLVRRYGFPETSTELIYNGADLTRFTPLTGEERERVRQSMAAEVGAQRWADDVLLVCTVARLSVQKGLFDLVAAAAEVVRQVPAARLVIVGDGELRSQLEARVAELHLTDQVLFAGARPLSELARWLGAVDLFVLSSHYEGMPLSLIEAMAAGCPVVATSVGGVGDVVSDDTVGRLVPPKDPAALARAIIEVFSNHEQRRAMASAARARAISSFDVRTCYGKTTAIYQRILHDSPSPLAGQGRGGG
jgi:glycosyltransferase involved in cell wall biosynthesis